MRFKSGSLVHVKSEKFKVLLQPTFVTLHMYLFKNEHFIVLNETVDHKWQKIICKHGCVWVDITDLVNLTKND